MAQPNDIDLAGRSQTVPCEHVGGPWDGLTEQRDLSGTQTEALLVQAVPTQDNPDALPFLQHRYAVILTEGHGRLVYRGCQPVPTPKG
jgi:hypothetical protein